MLFTKFMRRVSESSTLRRLRKYVPLILLFTHFFFIHPSHVQKIAEGEVCSEATMEQESGGVGVSGGGTNQGFYSTGTQNSWHWKHVRCDQ